MKTFDFAKEIEALSFISGISGCEEKTAEFFARRLETLCDEVKTDAMGNVLGIIRAESENAPTILIDSHSDEIGFLVCEHAGGGFVRLARVGGMDPGVLPASEVILYGEETVRAVVAAKPPHLLSAEDRKKKRKLEDLFVDTLLDDETCRRLCPIGTPVGFSDGVVKLAEHKIASRGLDDRVAGLTLLALAEALEKKALKANVALLFSVQEEVGGMGAKVAAFGLAPDTCLAVDVSFATFPGGEGRLLEMGKGAGISYSDTLSRTLTRDVIRVANEKEIPFQLLAEPGETGTNAHDIQVAGRGVASTIISLPLSYMHSPSEVIDTRDLESAVQLMKAYCENAKFFPEEVQIVG
ncbi:MAG: M20/M25/M40 family metallo-hydrolase [Clostridia bacterium]|nr:M20/M25/M40 family metallo-hydrolase [Clostridia bacterium]